MRRFTKQYDRIAGHKYKAKKTEYAGYSFASKGEAALFAELKLRQRAGMIRDIQVQDHVYLTEARILYVADFKIFETENIDTPIWIEFKGFETSEWRLKRRLWKFYGPGELRIYKQQNSRMILMETIRSAKK
jgi:hypothetical protein